MKLAETTRPRVNRLAFPFASFVVDEKETFCVERWEPSQGITINDGNRLRNRLGSCLMRDHLTLGGC